MQKTRKHAGAGHHGDRLEYPEVISSDIIAAMSDEDMALRYRALSEGLDRFAEARADTKPWEEELAYVRREQQIRRERRVRHEKYVREFERDYSASEFSLPAADLDNSSFTELFW